MGNENNEKPGEIKNNKNPELEQIAQEREAIKKEREQLHSMALTMKRNQLISLGHPNPDRVNKITSVQSLDDLIADYEEKKKNEKPLEKPADKPAEPETMKVNAGVPTVIFPDGSKAEANPQEVKFNANTPLQHYIDPMKVPRNVIIFNQTPNSRINPLPPTDDAPYWRIIA